MGVTAFPIVGGNVVAAGGDSSPRAEPGTIFARRANTDQWTLVQYVQLDNNGVDAGESCVRNFATVKQYSVKKAATGDGGAPFVGIALATIASQYYGYVAIGGHVGSADLSQTAASGEYLRLSGSVAGELTPNAASVFNAGTQGNASMFLVVAQARAAIATGTGSVSIVGIWGA